MPTIQCSFEDVKVLLGKKCSREELQEGLRAAKATLEGYDATTDLLTIALGDTNQPYLWSAEGLARFLRHYWAQDKGIPKLTVKKTNNMLHVDPKLASIRPYIAAFTAKGKPITDYLLKQLIQLQEKLAENFGRRRQKLALGLYPSKKIQFPLSYRAVDPETTAFIPLETTKKENLRRILEYNPKGKEYGWILKDLEHYPILEDAKQHILSFPPIINSHDTGKISVGDNDLFFEATGTDYATVQLATIIFAYALADRGFQIHQVLVAYKKGTEITPSIKEEKVSVTPEMIAKHLGLQLKKHEIKELLERAQYACVGNKVCIPPYRNDILHPVDVIEDIGIMYGYDRIEPLPLTTYTVGEAAPKQHHLYLFRDLLTGAGFQEIVSPILSNKELLYQKMNAPDQGTVEIENSMSHTYSAVRTWLLPLLLDVAARNKHVDYPHHIFEQGLVTIRTNDSVVDKEKISALAVHHMADYTEMRQLLDHIFSALGISFSVSPLEHPSCIPGRAGKIIVQKQNIGFLGELHPLVLEKFGLESPAVGIELDLSFLEPKHS